MSRNKIYWIYDIRQIRKIIETGENIGTEFKRCGNGIESDTYETVCPFSNRFGGDILCGVLDDGTVNGLPEIIEYENKKNYSYSCTCFFRSSYIQKKYTIELMTLMLKWVQQVELQHFIFENKIFLQNKKFINMFSWRIYALI